MKRIFLAAGLAAALGLTLSPVVADAASHHKTRHHKSMSGTTGSAAGNNANSAGGRNSAISNNPNAVEGRTSGGSGAGASGGSGGAGGAGGGR